MFNLVFTTFSYIMILKTVLEIGTPRDEFTALNTCLSHICAVPILSTTMLHCFAKKVSPLTHILMTDVFLLAEPLMNPIVYFVRKLVKFE